MSTVDQVKARCRSSVDSLVFPRSGLLCFLARRPGVLGRQVKSGLSRGAEEFGFVRSWSSPGTGPEQVSLFESAKTWLFGFSCSRDDCVSPEPHAVEAVSDATKNAVSTRIVDFVFSSFFEQEQPAETTDLGVLAIAGHPRTEGEEELSNWLLEYGEKLFGAASPSVDLWRVPNGGGCVLVLARFARCA